MAKDGGLEDVSKVKNMGYMFTKSHFNGDLSKWNVKSVNDMTNMFYGSSFNQNISNWELRKDCNIIGMFDKCPIEEEYNPEIK